MQANPIPSPSVPVASTAAAPVTPVPNIHELFASASPARPSPSTRLSFVDFELLLVVVGGFVGCFAIGYHHRKRNVPVTPGTEMSARQDHAGPEPSIVAEPVAKARKIKAPSKKHRKFESLKEEKQCFTDELPDRSAP
eukprot:7383326-Prymnesium_polylepis.3